MGAPIGLTVATLLPEADDDETRFGGPLSAWLEDDDPVLADVVLAATTRPMSPLQRP